MKKNKVKASKIYTVKTADELVKEIVRLINIGGLRFYKIMDDEHLRKVVSLNALEMVTEMARLINMAHSIQDQIEQNIYNHYQAISIQELEDIQKDIIAKIKAYKEVGQIRPDVLDYMYTEIKISDIVLELTRKAIKSKISSSTTSTYISSSAIGVNRLRQEWTEGIGRKISQFLGTKELEELSGFFGALGEIEGKDYAQEDKVQLESGITGVLNRVNSRSMMRETTFLRCSSSIIL